jgi:soluble lytic murein transglycosylase-like protein
MSRIAGPLLACAIALANAPAKAQAGAAPAAAEHREGSERSAASERHGASAQTPTADDVCRALEQSAAENALPVEFFARVIWQESRFDATTVSPKGAEGIAQFMPQTASWHGLSDPSIRSRRCGTRRLTYGSCWTGLAILDLLQRHTMQAQAESVRGLHTTVLSRPKRATMWLL